MSRSGETIGQVGTVLDLGSSTVTITSWVAKAGEPNEYMGFSFTLAGASSRSTSTTRLAGRNVGFCECDEAPPGGGGGSGSGSGSGSGNGDGTIL